MHKPVIVRTVMEMMDRERKYVLGEVVQITGLMPLLMKPRNKQRWTPEDRAALKEHLRRLSNISPYLVVLAMPGSFLMLPALAWWLLLANVFWAVAYDTEYAMVDRDDDLRIGIKTAAITLGRFDVAGVMLCYAAMLAVLAMIGRTLHFGVYYYFGLGAAGLLMLYHYTLIRERRREGCFKAFLHNNWVGGVVFAGIAANYAWG